ncbi:hypothetical protein NA57DRAFT_73707 [Rhizodiscina lignyota]|uniref:Myb-like domain-containing protein n=1 Tax=Rhizodiscina lignyota TaxID=1504668 RepID=A0A9P4IN40_9PEZI|nr:hypothetical protein NA57DRAFT_73707 [Rhizodiscina lignyota]
MKEATKAWTAEEKLEIMTSIVATHVGKVDWDKVDRPAGRTPRSTRDTVLAMLKAYREKHPDSDDKDASTAATEPATPKKRGRGRPKKASKNADSGKETEDADEDEQTAAKKVKVEDVIF